MKKPLFLTAIVVGTVAALQLLPPERRARSDDIRKYEAEKGTKVKCFGVMRCLYCPMSAVGCPIARLWMK
jgi:hypothetical protein